MIGPASQLGQRMLREKLRRHGFACNLPGGCLGAVLAKLERTRISRLCPGPAHAHETIGLVLLEQDLAAKNGDLLLRQNTRHGFERSPAARWRIVVVDLCSSAHAASFHNRP